MVLKLDSVQGLRSLEKEIKDANKWAWHKFLAQNLFKIVKVYFDSNKKLKKWLMETDDAELGLLAYQTKDHILAEESMGTFMVEKDKMLSDPSKWCFFGYNLLPKTAAALRDFYKNKQ